jgi:hypothetical protein
VTDTETTAVAEIIAEGMAGEGVAADAAPGPQDAAARVAGLVSPEAVDRMLADAEQAGMSAQGPASELTRTVLERALGAEPRPCCSNGIHHRGG